LIASVIMHPNHARLWRLPSAVFSIVRMLAFTAGISVGLATSTNAGENPVGPAINGQQASKDTATPASDWTVSVGASVVTGPKYPGSSSRLVIPIPAWEIDYKNRFFSKGLDFAGVYFLNDESWKLGSALSYDITDRRHQADGRLKGLGDVNSTLRAKVFAEHTMSLFTLAVAAAQDIAGNGQGLLLSLDASCAIPFIEPWFFSFGPGITWSNGEYAHTFFGVTRSQSARSGLPAFDADPGLMDVHFNAVVSYSITERWTVSGVLGLARLTGSAADSPITQTKYQETGVISLEYKF